LASCIEGNISCRRELVSLNPRANSTCELRRGHNKGTLCSRYQCSLTLKDFSNTALLYRNRSTQFVIHSLQNQIEAMKLTTKTVLFF
jgi:hypothetical protein